MQRLRKTHRRVLFYIRTELKALWFIISCTFKSVTRASALKKAHKRMKSGHRQTDLALPDALNNINSEHSWWYKLLCHVWHLPAFRLGQHLSKSLTFVLRVCFIFLFFNLAASHPKSGVRERRGSCEQQYLAVQPAIGSSPCNQSSVLKHIWCSASGDPRTAELRFYHHATFCFPRHRRVSVHMELLSILLFSAVFFFNRAATVVPWCDMNNLRQLNSVTEITGNQFWNCFFEKSA